MARSNPSGDRNVGRWTATNSEGFVAPVGLAVDVVLLSVRESRLEVVVIEPPGGGLALPGGFVTESESAEDAVGRHLEMKVGLSASARLEQLACLTKPDRDPRGWIPSVAYVALVPPEAKPGVPTAAWASAMRPPRLQYDHRAILKLAIERVRGKLWWSNVAGGILRGVFTMTEARGVYEAIGGRALNPSTYARDLLATGLVEATGSTATTSRGRPAALYRFKSKKFEWGEGRKKRIAA